MIDTIRRWLGLPPRPRVVDHVRELNETLVRINKKLDKIATEDDPLKQLVRPKGNGSGVENQK